MRERPHLDAALLAGRASGQSAGDRSYEVGLRTTFMLSPRPLAELGGAARISG